MPCARSGDPHLLARRFEVIAADACHHGAKVRARAAIRRHSPGDEWRALGTGAEIGAGRPEPAGHEPCFPVDRFDVASLVRLALRAPGGPADAADGAGLNRCPQ